VVPLLPADANLTSTGAISFPDANRPADGRRDPRNKQQVGFQAIFLPTSDGQSAVSTYPGERNPVLSLVAYRGDLGLDTGIPHSVYTLDTHQIDSGALVKLDQRINLHPGESASLDDGSTVTFLSTQPWVNITVRYDPGERIVLGGAVCLLIGLVTMLVGKRRRVWFRVAAGRTAVRSPRPAPWPGRSTAASPEEFDALVEQARQEGKT